MLGCKFGLQIARSMLTISTRSVHKCLARSSARPVLASLGAANSIYCVSSGTANQSCKGRKPRAAMMQLQASSASDGVPPAGSKLKLLCLHGYTQTADANAAFVTAEERNQQQGVENGRSWWQLSARPSKATAYSGWEATLDVLVDAIIEHKPDGILGFSQGATATALLLTSLPRVAHRLADAPTLKCAIMISGFLPRDPAFADMIKAAKPSIPSLFVCGAKDTLVPLERTQELVQAFDAGAVTVYEHAGAHLVPTCTGAFKAAMVDFLDSISGGSTGTVQQQQQQQTQQTKQQVLQARQQTQQNSSAIALTT